MGPQSGAGDAWIDQICAHGSAGDLAGVDPHHGFERGLAGGIGAVIGRGVAREPAGDKDRPSRRRGSQQRVHRPDKPPIRGQVEVDDLAPNTGIGMTERREDAELGGVADEDIESAKPFV